MDLIHKPPDDDDLPLPKPWDERPISYARWRKHRETIMQWAHPGKRPPEWWAYERKMRRPNDREAEALLKMGELSEAELAKLMPEWRHRYERGQDPKFSYCIGHAKPSDTFATWIEGPEARRRFYAWAEIPRVLIKQWNAERRRTTRVVRRLKKVAKVSE